MDLRSFQKVVSLESIYADYKSTDFLLMLIRVFSAMDRNPDIRVWLYEPDGRGTVLDWLYEEQERTMNDPRPFFYLVTGAMNPKYCNRYNMGKCRELLANPGKYPGFVMRGMTSPFILISDDNVCPDDPAAVTCDGVRYGNNIFSAFYSAALRGDKRFSLYRMERRISCFWVACGGRMVIGDVYSTPVCGREREKMFKIICVEGPPDAIAELADTEFENNLVLASHASRLSRMVLDNLDERARELYMKNNRIIPNSTLTLERLKPAGDDFTLVHHFNIPAYKAGSFLLTVGEDMWRAVDEVDEMEKTWLSFADALADGPSPTGKGCPDRLPALPLPPGRNEHV